jgi:hypothetical protein
MQAAVKPTSLAAACRTIVYTLVDVAALTGELNASHRTTEEINKMAQSQLVEAASAMRKMKSHVENLAQTKREYERQIDTMGIKLAAAQEEAKNLRNMSLGGEKNQVSAAELQAARDELEFLRTKIKTTEENCKQVLSRLGVSDSDADAEKEKRPAAASRPTDDERPSTAPARVRFPEIQPGRASVVNRRVGGEIDAREMDALAVVTQAAPTRAHHNLHDASPPSGKEVREYGEHLGLNPAVDEEFMWIAEEALCAPLPAGWSEHFRPEHNAVYYFNTHTQDSTWNHPMEDYYRILLESLKQLKLELKMVQATGKSLFAVSRIGSKANAIMKAHNEKLAALLLEEDPQASHGRCGHFYAPVYFIGDSPYRTNRRRVGGGGVKMTSPPVATAVPAEGAPHERRVRPPRRDAREWNEVDSGLSF